MKFFDSTNRIVIDGNSSFLASTLDAEALALVEPYVEPIKTPEQLLAQLDSDNTLTQRNLRETVMLMAEAFKTVTNGAVDLSQIHGVAKVYEVEAQAQALRAQL
jgi:hypothetical protein